MKKSINLELTPAEKNILKAKKVKQKDLLDYAPDEITSLLNASPGRAKILHALHEFQSIPSVGVKFAHDLMFLGYYDVASLKNKAGHKLLNDYEKLSGFWTDPCVEDQFRLVVHYANNPGSKKQWWDFTAERKAFRSQYGYPATRPGNTWHAPAYQEEKMLAL